MNRWPILLWLLCGFLSTNSINKFIDWLYYWDKRLERLESVERSDTLWRTANSLFDSCEKEILTSRRTSFANYFWCLHKTNGWPKLALSPSKRKWLLLNKCYKSIDNYPTVPEQSLLLSFSLAIQLLIWIIIITLIIIIMVETRFDSHNNDSNSNDFHWIPIESCLERFKRNIDYLNVYSLTSVNWMQSWQSEENTKQILWGGKDWEIMAQHRILIITVCLYLDEFAMKYGLELDKW